MRRKSTLFRGISDNDGPFSILVVIVLFIIYSAHKGNDFFSKERFFEPNLMCL